jgi:catechol 2,3-dioxygenase-like lactoylglutathione lyase family enzyme
VGRQLTPELDVSDIQKSLAFYIGMLGFRVLYERPAEGFAYLDLDGVPLMLEAAEGPGRRFPGCAKTQRHDGAADRRRLPSSSPRWGQSFSAEGVHCVEDVEG